DLLQRVEKLQNEKRQLEKEVQQSKSSAMRSHFDDIARSAKNVGGINYIGHRLDDVDDKQLREVADRLRDSGRLGLVVLASAAGGKVSFVVSVNKEIASGNLHAGKVAKEFA